MVSSPLAVPAVTIPIVPEHGGSGVNRLKKFVLDLFCLGSLRLSNAYRGVVMTREAQDPRQSAPGQFDFYVLSLSCPASQNYLFDCAFIFALAPAPYGQVRV